MDLLANYLSDPQPEQAEENTKSLGVKCDALRSGEMSQSEARTRLMIAYHLVRQHPSEEAPQLVALELLNRAGVTQHMAETWEALYRRFPTRTTILKNLIDCLAQEYRRDHAAQLIEAHFEGSDLTLKESTTKAELYTKLEDYTHSDALFRDLIEREPNSQLPRLIFGKSLFNRGDVLEAFAVLEPLRRGPKSADAANLIKATDRAIIAMETIKPKSSRSTLTRSAALLNVLSLFTKRTLAPISPDSVQKISLAAGRLDNNKDGHRTLQLANFIHRSGVSWNGAQRAVTCEVLSNTHENASNWQSLLSTYAARGLFIHQRSDFASTPFANPPQGAEFASDLFALLPETCKQGLEHFLDHFRQETPDLLVLTSQEAILPFVPAALMANIPQIIITVSNEPPDIKDEMTALNYRALYQALLDIPGISLATSTQHSAQAYESWLNAPEGTVAVLPDPAFPAPKDPPRNQTLLWQSFEIATQGANQTLAFYLGDKAAENPKELRELIEALISSQVDLRILAILSPKAENILDGLNASHDRRILALKDTPDSINWLTHADIFTTRETSSDVHPLIAQAQLMGIPTLMSTDPSTAEWLPPTEIAQSLTTSAFALPNTLSQLLTNKFRRLSLGNSCKDHAMQRHAPQLVFRRWMEVILTAAQLPQEPETIPVSTLPHLSNRPLLRKGAVKDAYRIVAQEPGTRRSSL